MAQKGAGGRLSRSEVTTVRFDPKLKLALELAARKQRRTVSSFIEWSVEQATKEVVLFDNEEIAEEPDYPLRWSAYYTAQRIFSVDKAEAFLERVFEVPHLLNFEEEQKWHLIKNTDYFWEKPHKVKGREKIIRPRARANLHVDKVQKRWEDIEAINKGAENNLPKLDLSYLEDEE